MSKKLTILIAAAILCTSAVAQVSREEVLADPDLSLGLYMPYPGPLQLRQSPAPRGYEPFYISHLGRHGSRWHTKSEYYERPLAVLDSASARGALTPLGEDVLRRVRLIAEDARGRKGELTAMGFRQHRGIADRMYNHYKGVFRKGRKVTAKSTGVPRVVMSMQSFCARLRECEPGLDMTLNASGRCRYSVARLDKHGSKYWKNDPVWEQLKEFRDSLTQPERLMSSLFTDQSGIDAKSMMADLFEVMGIAHDTDLGVSIDDIFTPEERYDLWQADNAEFYLAKGPCPLGGEALKAQGLPMLKDFIKRADEAIADGNVAADLRFSHDSYIAPLTTTMQLGTMSRGETTDLNEIASKWCDWRVSPMASNIQWVFYRNRQGDVIVKFLLQEQEVDIPVQTDMYPYYRWEDVKAYYSNQYSI